jgi:hypothetical protein
MHPAAIDLAPAFVEIRCLLELIGDTQDQVFAKVRPQDLQSNGQILRGEPTRDGDSRDAGKTGRQCTDIAQLHLQRIVSLFTK